MRSSAACATHSPAAAARQVNNAQCNHTYVWHISPQKFPSQWGSGSSSNLVSWALMSQPPNGMLIGSDVFAQLTRVPNTHGVTQTHRSRYARHLSQYLHLHSVQAMRPLNDFHRRFCRSLEIFNNGTCERVLNLLKSAHLRLCMEALNEKRITVVKFLMMGCEIWYIMSSDSYKLGVCCW